jgi:hypothetical protein
MKSIYTQVQEQMLSYKSAYEISIDTLGKLVIPVELPIRDFFVQTQRLMLMGEEFANLLSSDPGFRKSPLASLQEMNQRYFASLEPDTGYQSSLENPDYAVKLYGIPMGQLITALCVQYRQVRQHHITGNYFQLEQILDLYFKLYDLASSGNTDFETWKNEYRKMTMADIKLKSMIQNALRLCPEFSYYRNIVQTADLSDPRYLYLYGSSVNEHDIAMAEYVNQYPAKDLEALAAFIVQSWVDGFVRAKKDYRIKNYANLIIPCGMERLGRLIITELEKIGMQALVPAPHNRGLNKQYSYDHRFNSALVMDRDFVDQSLAIAETILEELKETIRLQAGPVYVELFGETPFSPISKASAIQLNPDQQQLYREFTGRNAQLYYKYYKRDEASFTIIAFPSPEIGAKFPEIFADTLKINLLDSNHYARIQQKIIDVLDTADFVHVKGKPGNDTDIMVKMHPITDPEHQTNFENCVADVNIPVGEVFTSPLLTGTTGTLHVEDIYLGSLRYYNIKLHFEDGWVKDYSCTNYSDPAEAKKYIHENLLLPHTSLPIGEFAIGTNTTAYQIAKKHDILALLPILIIEKMGPHFAIGDTCFSHEEDAPHPSFMNGKEMIAVENEHSAKRKEDPLGAYTQKHMDITLPYEMLASITAIAKDGTKTDIIRDGRFVVPGTEELNFPLENL